MILLLLFYDYRLEIFREGMGIEAIMLMLNQVSFSVIYIIDGIYAHKFPAVRHI